MSDYADLKPGDEVRLTGEKWETIYDKGFRCKVIKEVAWSGDGARGVVFEEEPDPWFLIPGYEVEKVESEEPMLTHDTDYNYYLLPSGVEARDVSQFLSSFAGQIVQYAVRSGRMDGKVKSVEDRVRDFEKIADFARWEADRLLQYPEDV